jgi:hypothetical protein
MNRSRCLVLAAAALAIPALAASRTTSNPLAPALRAPHDRHHHDGDACDDVASAIRTATEDEANADYWLAIARCRNDPGCDARAGEREAKADLRDALDLAKAQYQARLDVCDALGGGVYAPDLDPADFSTTIDNSWFPLVPGHTMVYEGQTADGLEHDEVTATDTTITFGGVSVRQVEDVVTVDGVLVEHATDYYAQKSDGSVWYFGEISRNYEDGLLDNLDGSWRTGKDGALPGIQMPGAPADDAFYRQEFLPNEAEDVARVVSTDETVQVGFGTFEHCVQIEESNPLEPDALGWKFYAPGVGLVLDVDLVTGDRVELIGIE